MLFYGSLNRIKTPTYYVFDMFKEHQGANAIETFVTDNDDFMTSVSLSASIKDGKTLITIANLSCTEDAEISLESIDRDIPDIAEATLLYADDMHAHNAFEAPDTVTATKIEIAPKKTFAVPKVGIISIRF